MSINLDIRCNLPDRATVFDNFAFDNSIIGVTLDNRVIYCYDSMVEELMEETDWSVEEAMDWIDYNVAATLSDCTDSLPLIVSYCVGSY